MARIIEDQFEHLDKNRFSVHDVTYAGYSTFKIDGKNIFKQKHMEVQQEK